MAGPRKPYHQLERGIIYIVFILDIMVSSCVIYLFVAMIEINKLDVSQWGREE